MDSEAKEAELSVPEAVLLGHALVSKVADNTGTRAFFIKGPASVLQGLRLPKTSGDVDVFVSPGDLETMLSGLRERGWRKRPVDPDSRTFPQHSVTVDHPDWPCCIDIHFRFPGMENDPADCFEMMWTNTGGLELAALDVRVPTKALGIVILALHALRSPHLPECRRELRFLAELSERQSHAAAILDVAGATGSLTAIRPFLEDLLPQSVTVEWPEASTEWWNRLLAKEPGTARIRAVVQAPLRHKSKLLFRAVFPYTEVFLIQDIYADLSFVGRLRLLRSRWARFLRSAPMILRDLAQLRNHKPTVDRSGSLLFDDRAR